jgi:hypothetical protein
MAEYIQHYEQDINRKESADTIKPVEQEDDQFVLIHKKPMSRVNDAGAEPLDSGDRFKLQEIEKAIDTLLGA